MNSETLLEKLRDIRLPDPPPPEPVWDIWLAMALFAIAIGLFLFNARQHKRSLQRDALREIDRIDTTETRLARVELAKLTRRIAITMTADDDSSRVAHLTGDAYQESLDKLFRTKFFTTGDGQALGDALYQPVDKQLDIIQLRSGLRNEIKRIKADDAVTRQSDQRVRLSRGVQQS